MEMFLLGEVAILCYIIIKFIVGKKINICFCFAFVYHIFIFLGDITWVSFDNLIGFHQSLTDS